MERHPGENSLDLTPVSPQTAAEWDQYFDLRWRVLRAPWQQPRGSERDEREADSQHLMIPGADSRPLAVGRLHFNSPDEGQVRFMAVEPEAQGRGLGGVILKELERRARVMGAKGIVLNARQDVERFYNKHGFVTVGAAPTLFGVLKHVRMRKDLSEAASH